MNINHNDKNPVGSVNFSIAAYAAWAPNLDTESAWQAWANDEIAITGLAEPKIEAMSPMLRRRASTAGKMALEVAFQCLGARTHVPLVFCSRHGECERSVELLSNLARKLPISPTSFSMSVHNATAGLLSIARHEHTNMVAIAANHSTIEHAVIEACGLLIENSTVLLIAYDMGLPEVFKPFQDCKEQPFAWAWLIQPPTQDVMTLSWSSTKNVSLSDLIQEAAGLEILRFFIRKQTKLERISNGRCWQWTRHA